MITNPLEPWRSIPGRRKRASSYDRSGGNRDYVLLKPGQTETLMQHQGASGCILRIWFTLNSEDPAYLRNTLVSMRFDGTETVHKIPIGMFTATGPWAVNDVRTQPVSVMRSRKMNKDQEGTGFGSFNLVWRMPFAEEAVIEVHNTSEHEMRQHFYVDYLLDGSDERMPLLFHATHSRAIRTTPAAIEPIIGGEARNLSAADNHLIAAIDGYTGNYVGTVMAVESHPDRCGKWYEGDDMFFIDGEPWPPSLHGTGTEDYFGMAWGIHREYQSWDHGVSHYERSITDHDRFYDGRFVLFRWHLADPIPFHKCLHVSIEAGHANDCEQYYESVAFWYGRRIEQVAEGDAVSRAP